MIASGSTAEDTSLHRHPALEMCNFLVIVAFALFMARLEILPPDHLEIKVP